MIQTLNSLHTVSMSAARIHDEKTRIQQQIETTDKQIDKLVYELYGLTEDEIKIVEEKK